MFAIILISDAVVKPVPVDPGPRKARRALGDITNKASLQIRVGDPGFNKFIFSIFMQL